MSPPTPPLRKTADQLRITTNNTTGFSSTGTGPLNQKEMQAQLEKELISLNDFKKNVDHAKASFHEEAKSFQSFLEGMALCSARQDSSTLMDVWDNLLDALIEEDVLCRKLLSRRKKEKEERLSREKLKSENNNSNNLDDKSASTTNQNSNSSNVVITGMASGALKNIDGRMEFGHNGVLISLELGSVLLCNEDVQETIFKLISALMQRHGKDFTMKRE